MITLHHLENSQSIRILWLLEELEAPYELVLYERDRKTFLAPEAFKRRSPLGTAPFIADGDLVLGETNAIVEHLLDRFGELGLRPGPGDPERLKYLFWFHAIPGSLQPLLTTLFLLNAVKTRAPALLRPLARMILGPLESLFLKPRLAALYRLMEADLSRGDWLAGGRFTAADVVMGYSLEIAVARAGLDGEEYPNTHAYLARLRARPAYQRAVEKGGPLNPLAG